MGPPGGGRNPTTNRLLRHFNLLALTEMSDDSCRRIFSTILGSFVSKYFNEKVIVCRHILNLFGESCSVKTAVPLGLELRKHINWVVQDRHQMRCVAVLAHGIICCSRSR